MPAERLPRAFRHGSEVLGEDVTPAESMMALSHGSADVKNQSARAPFTPEPLSSRGQVTKRLLFAGVDEGGNEKATLAAEDDVKTPLYESPSKKSKSHPCTDNENEEKSPITMSKRVLDFGSAVKSVRWSSRLQKPDEVEAPSSPHRTEPLISSMRGSANKPAKRQPKSAARTPARHKPGEKIQQRARRLRCVAQKTEHAKKGKTTVTKKARKEFSKVVFDGIEFRIGDSVYVKRLDSSSDSDEAECEHCQICNKVGRGIMVECEECLGGFHLSCLKPPLKEVPEDKWFCPYCETNEGNTIQRRRRRKTKKTAREKLLNSELWAARIDRYALVFFYILCRSLLLLLLLSFLIFYYYALMTLSGRTRLCRKTGGACYNILNISFQ